MGHAARRTARPPAPAPAQDPAPPLELLRAPTRNLFFTGKGGVGKTSVACAVALALAASGRAVLLVSTDPASNLGEMLEVALGPSPTAVPGAPGLSALDIDPDAVAEAYRRRVLDQLDPATPPAEREAVREQMSGACTTEIAAFDAFAGLLADDAAAWDHVVFDTAPTGHTLRLLSLPRAWTGFLAGNDRGASCLGPHSGLKMREARFRAAFAALGDARATTIVLVTRAEPAALREAARTADELRALGLGHQRLVVNGMLVAPTPGDPLAAGISAAERAALDALPAALADVPCDRIGLRPFDMVGLDALRTLIEPAVPSRTTAPAPAVEAEFPGLDALVDELALGDHGLVMVMGKGGVGKTTVAAAIALGLAARGHAVHLTTTDPAAHLAATLDGAVQGLAVDRIDPRAETESYVAKIMATRGRDLDAEGRRLLREDLASPCSEEVAVFHAFARTVAEARQAFVVLDTAPTGHTLLLMDATGAYHRQVLRDQSGAGRLVTPLMRLRDPGHTKVVLVTLPETTPVSEAARLQDDLRRAGIEPFAWVVNRALVGLATRDAVLAARIARQRAQVARVAAGLARRVHVVPWQATPPVGLAALGALAAPVASRREGQ